MDAFISGFCRGKSAFYSIYFGDGGANMIKQIHFKIWMKMLISIKLLNNDLRIDI